MRTLLLIILVLLLIGALPAWPYSTGWGLLSERRTRSDLVDRADPYFDGHNLTLKR